MSKMSFKTAFQHYGAKLTNPNWAVSAQAKDGSVVISCWAHNFQPAEGGVMRYVDSLSKWRGSNSLGRNLLEQHLEAAYAQQLKVRLVLARTNDEDAVGESARDLLNTFAVRDDLIGKVTHYDGNTYIIEFRRAKDLEEEEYTLH